MLFIFKIILLHFFVFIEIKGEKLKDIYLSEECKTDVSHLCDHIKQGSNLEVLLCLQRSEKVIETISKPCQHFLWQFKKSYLNTEYFNMISNNNCKPELISLKSCSNLKIDEQVVCLLKHKNEITNKLCLLYLDEAASIVFSDIVLVNNFLNQCNENIENLKCGRLQSSNSGFYDKAINITSQATTISCLVMNLETINSECRKQILRLGELQSDDFHHDPTLYYACREDRETFCSSVDSGNSQVYRCLEKNKYNKNMSEKCKNELNKKQKLEGFDYKIRKYFTDKCANDITNHKCAQSTDNRDAVKLSAIILCLLKADAEESPENRLDPQCRSEVLIAREQFAKHPQISTNLQQNCGTEINKYCSKIDSKTDNILHCLMRNSMPALQQSFSHKCTLAMKKFFKVVDPTEDIAQLDPVVSLACSNELKTRCSDSKMKEPDDRYECLLQQIDADSDTFKLSDDCRASLLTLAYFVERDYSLNHKLRKNCQKDVMKLCKVALKKETDEQSLVPHAIVHCLVQRWNSAMERSTLSYKCELEIKAIMNIEASNLKLNIRVYSSCFNDVMKYCANDQHKMDCLQLKYQNLQDTCKTSISEFLSLDKEEYSLKKLIARSCGPMVRIFCKSELSSPDNDYMGCLVRNKLHERMERSCRIAIEHYQIISLEDFKINHKFTRFCSIEIKTFCGSLLTGDQKSEEKVDDDDVTVSKKPISKSDIIACLSKTLTTALLKNKNPFSSQCYEQFTFEFLQRSDSPSLDPEMHDKCKTDINQHCTKIDPDQILSCLQQYQDSLSDHCYSVLVARQQLSALDTGFDSGIQRYCQEMIDTYCHKEKKNKVFRCLHVNMRRDGFNRECRMKVFNRLKRRLAEVRLNPELVDNCKKEMNIYCNVTYLSGHISEIHHKEKIDIVNCLRWNYLEHKISFTGPCRHLVLEIVMDSHSDYRLDPYLYKNCNQDVKQLCQEQLVKDDVDLEGRVQDCLKHSLLGGKIRDNLCSHEIYRLLQEGRADVHVDIQLYNACRDEISRICFSERIGAGRKLSCLLWALEDKHTLPFLSKGCVTVLHERKEMWELASRMEAPGNVQQVLGLIVESQSRYYILMIVTILCMVILLTGILCGRATKRVNITQKRR